jgi:hypothetical protein
MDVQGHCDERFAGVAEEFERNLAARGELGASPGTSRRGLPVALSIADTAVVLVHGEVVARAPRPPPLAERSDLLQVSSLGA